MASLVRYSFASIDLLNKVLSLSKSGEYVLVMDERRADFDRKTGVDSTRFRVFDVCADVETAKTRKIEGCNLYLMRITDKKEIRDMNGMIAKLLANKESIVIKDFGDAVLGINLEFIESSKGGVKPAQSHQSYNLPPFAIASLITLPLPLAAICAANALGDIAPVLMAVLIPSGVIGACVF